MAGQDSNTSKGSCRCHLHLSLLIFQWAERPFQHITRLPGLLMSHQRVIGFFLKRNFEDPGLGSLIQQIQADAFGLLAYR